MAHVPVLLEEVLKFLDPKPGEDFIDCTIGGGGHACAILERTAPNGRLLGIDLSAAAVRRIETTLAQFGDRLILAPGNFKELKTIAYDAAITQCAGILMDLGFSSDELANPALGLSFQTEGPLDMRLSGTGITAAEIVNGWTEARLVEIFQKYGEERYARSIARAIVRARKQKRIITTKELVAAIIEAVPPRYEHGRIHPATRTFQALRIAVNDELGNLEVVLPQAVELLQRGGRVAVISFHSLEDRIVKRFFREQAGKTLRVLTKRPIQAGEEEVRQNPRARSAKLRVAEKM